MNRSDLVAHVAIRARISKRAAGDAIDALLESLTRAIADGDRINLPGFGTFEQRIRMPRIARNPRTGEPVTIPATKVPVFRPAKALREACSSERASTTTHRRRPA